MDEARTKKDYKPTTLSDDASFTSVNKHGARAIDKVRRLSAIFESDDQLMTFPAGLVSRRTKGLVRDTEWQKSNLVKDHVYIKN